MKAHIPYLIVGLALIVSTAGLLRTRGQEVLKPGQRREFMRMKLEYSKNVLEGLAQEDFEQIAENARKLNLLSMAAEWNADPIPHVEEYVPQTTEFQRITDDLRKKARARNLDGATLAFTRLTMSCVDCHKYVRGATRPKPRPLDSGPPKP